MRVVKKKKNGDCGVCAVASIMRTSWHRARDAIWLNRPLPKTSFGTTTKELLAAIRLLGGTVNQNKLRPVRQWEKVPPNSVVCVRMKTHGANWHWVVWDGKHVICNSDGKVLPEQYKMKLQSYFHVEENNGLRA